MTQPLHKKRECNIDSFGFIILCPERNIGGLRNTVSSIRTAFPDFPYICMVGDDASKVELLEMKNICETHQGSDTITSLINQGMKKSKTEWNCVVFAGSWLKHNIYRKFDLFVRSEKDILFPVVDGKTNFYDGSMNGIIIHKRTFEEVGEFSTSPMQKGGYNELELIKLFWSFNAIEKGCTFKAIVGMRVC